MLALQNYFYFERFKLVKVSQYTVIHVLGNCLEDIRTYILSPARIKPFYNTLQSGLAYLLTKSPGSKVRKFNVTCRESASCTKFKQHEVTITVGNQVGLAHAQQFVNIRLKKKIVFFVL